MRINEISNLINNKKVVVDVGSDHSFLAIKLLKMKKAKHIINIEKNLKPLENGIKNIEKNNLLDKTTNILNDGLIDINKKIKLRKINTLTISGMGGKLILSIIKNNSIKIKNMILVPNNNYYSLRKYLIQNKYKIIFEKIILENNKYYFLIQCKKSMKKYSLSEIELNYGKYNINNLSDEFIGYLKKEKNYIIKNKIDKLNKIYNDKILMIESILCKKKI